MPEEIMIKTYEAEIKEVEGERAFNVTITTTAVDRDGDIVEAKGAKLTNYRKNPVVLMAHDYRGLPIGKAENLVKTDDDIKAKVIFPPEGDYPLADIVHRLYKGKFMRAWSIGFIPIKTEDIVDEDEKGKGEECRSRGKRIKSWELLEFSACAVPSNPEALNNMMAKGINIDTLKEAGFIEIEEDIVENVDKVFIEEIAKQTDKEIMELGDEEEKEVILKPEETEEFIHIPVRSAADFVKESFRTIDIDAKKGIKAVIGKLKSDPDGSTKVQKYIFDKGKGWTLASAQEWVEEHKKEYEEADLEELFLEEKKEENKEYDALIKSLEDMILTLNVSETIKENEELKEKVDKLENEKEEIELKAGAVLNAKNKSNLKNAQALIQTVLDSAEPEEEDSLEIEDEKDNKDDDTVIDLENNTVDDPVIDEEKDEDAIEVDEKVIAKAINEKMSYILGKVKK